MSGITKLLWQPNHRMAMIWATLKVYSAPSVNRLTKRLGHWYHTHIGKEQMPNRRNWCANRNRWNFWFHNCKGHPYQTAWLRFPLPGNPNFACRSEGNELTGNSVEGNLCIKFHGFYGSHRLIGRSWALQANLFLQLYPGMYFTGDGVKRDHDGYYRILGRCAWCHDVSVTEWEPPKLEMRLNEHPTLV